MKTKISFAFFCALLLLPNLMHLQNLLADKSLAVAGMYTLFSISLTLLPLVILPPLIYCLLMLLFLLIMPFELIHVINYDGYTTLAAFTSTFNTNPGELTEFMHSYRHFLYATYPLILLTFVALAKYLKKDYRLHKSTKIIIAGIFLGTAALFTAKTSYDLYDRENANMVGGLKELYSRLLSQSYPYSHFIKIDKFLEQHEIVQQALAAKSDFSFGSSVKPGILQTRPIVVLVIGETSRAQNWQLNGYHRNTTPLLAQRDNLHYFTDSITAATHTSQTIQLVLSRATPQDLEPIYKEKSIVSAFKEAGYKTVWISNQNMTGGVETAVYTISTEADVKIFTGADYNVQAQMDEVLIPELSRVLHDNMDSPLFVVIHTMGSHEVYRMRYPPEFEKYKPASRGDDYNFSSPGIRERLLNSYDNSVLYTDYVLDKIIRTIDDHKRESSVTFFSDHGENLLDDENNRFGHGGVIPTLFVTDVPVFIWTSSEFITNNPAMDEALSKNIDKPISNLYLFDTLLDIGGITIKDYVTDNSLVNGKFSPRERHILNTSYKPISYEKLKKISSTHK